MKTTAEQIEDTRRLVAWVLWNIVTRNPNIDKDYRYTKAEVQAIQGHAEVLFQNSTWMATVVGEWFAGEAIRKGE